MTYLLGTFQLGRFLSTTKVYYEADAPSRDDFVFAQLIHEGDWDPDPSAVHNLLKFARDNSTLEVKFKRAERAAERPQGGHLPAAVHDRAPRVPLERGRGGPAAALPEGRRDAAGRRLLRADGVRRGLPPRDRQGPARAAKLERLPLDHPLYHCHYDIRRVDYTPRVREDFGPFDTPELEGITLDGRLAVVYSRFDLGNGWEQFPHAYSYGLKERSAMQIGANILVYAVTH